MKRYIARFLLFSVIALCVLIIFSCTRSKPYKITTLSGTIEPGDTLSDNLSGLAISQLDIITIAHALNKVHNLRDIRPGDSFEIDVDTSTQWQSFRYYPQKDVYFSVALNQSGNIDVNKIVFSTSTTLISTYGRVKTSLWEAMRSQGVDPVIILDFADILSGMFDFVTDTRPGDLFRVVYEKTVRENGTLVNMHIIGAQYTSRGETLTAVLHTHRNGSSGYYDLDGDSLARQFLRAPLQYRRISSHFTKKRFHPILKYFRPHLGIDYAAPKGTPVSCIGDGTVKKAGWNGGFGKYVEIKHPNGYTSGYGHLSKIARGIRPGKRVKQGQLVGSVGSTGLSTGPHLDFRIKKGRTFVNFLRLKLPPMRRVPSKEKKQFKESVRSTLQMLAKKSLEKN